MINIQHYNKILQPTAHAVAAIILTEDDRFLMQLRDDFPSIYYPGHFGCFGGAINHLESPEDALHRELYEELLFTFSEAVYFTNFSFDFSFAQKGILNRTYYIVRIASAKIANLVLCEGAAMNLFLGRDILEEKRVTPYDSFAIWLFLNQKRIVG